MPWSRAPQLRPCSGSGINNSSSSSSSGSSSSSSSSSSGSSSSSSSSSLLPWQRSTRPGRQKRTSMLFSRPRQGGRSVDLGQMHCVPLQRLLHPQTAALAGPAACNSLPASPSLPAVAPGVLSHGSLCARRASRPQRAQRRRHRPVGAGGRRPACKRVPGPHTLPVGSAADGQRRRGAAGTPAGAGAAPSSRLVCGAAVPRTCRQRNRCQRACLANRAHGCCRSGRHVDGGGSSSGSSSRAAKPRHAERRGAAAPVAPGRRRRRRRRRAGGQGRQSAVRRCVGHACCCGLR